MSAGDEPLRYQDYSKSYESAVWKGFLAVLTLIFVLAVFNCGKEVYYYVNGQYAEGNLYRNENYLATAVSGGHFTQVSISRAFNKVVDNKVDLFYINDDINTAMPMTKPWIWVMDFIVIFMLYALFIYKIYKIYWKKPYWKKMLEKQNNCE